MKKHDYKVTVDKKRAPYGRARLMNNSGECFVISSIDAADELARRWNAEPELREMLEYVTSHIEQGIMIGVYKNLPAFVSCAMQARAALAQEAAK